MSLLLCFSGQIGSGKSSVSTAVAAALGWPRTGFGDYLRNEIVRLGGDPSDRKVLQDIGQRRVESDPVSFCQDVLIAAGFRPGQDFIVDGIRHVSIYEILVTLSKPSQTRLIFLEATEIARSTRVQTRGDALDFARASTHRAESELLDSLPKRADSIVNSDQPLDAAVSDCIDHILQWQKIS